MNPKESSPTTQPSENSATSTAVTELEHLIADDAKTHASGAQASVKATSLKHNGVHKEKLMDYVLMCTLFILGLASCILHHVFNVSRHGKEANNNDWVSLNNQYVVSFIGTAFAFITKALYGAAIGAAFQQVVWRSWSKYPFSLGVIDGMVSLTSDARSFRHGDLWRYGKRAVLLALIFWLSSFGTVFTPGTLTTVGDTMFNTFIQAVPTLDFLALNNNKTYGNTLLDSQWEIGHTPTPDLIKLVRLTAYGGNVVPGLSPCGKNCTYTVSFPGPALKCDSINNYSNDNGNPWQQEDFSSDPRNLTYNNIYNSSQLAIYNAPPKPNPKYNHNHTLWVSYAFRPRGYRRFNASLSVTNDSVHPMLLYPNEPFPPATGWERHTFRCHDYNASYTVNVTYINGIQSTNLTDFHYLNKVDYFGPGIRTAEVRMYQQAHRNIFVHDVINTALSEIITGWMYAQPQIFDSETHLSNTALVEAFLIERQYYLGLGKMELVDTRVYVPIPELREGLEDLSRNVTLSLLGLHDLVYRDTKEHMATVVTWRYQIVYKYKPFYLLLSYAVLSAAAGVSVVVGAWAISKNGFLADMAFSRMLFATRDVDVAESEGDKAAMKTMLRVRKDEDTGKVKFEVEGMKKG